MAMPRRFPLPIFRSAETGGSSSGEGPNEGWIVRWSNIIRNNRPDLTHEKSRDFARRFWTEWKTWDEQLRESRPEMGDDERRVFLEGFLAHAGLSTDESLKKSFRSECAAKRPDATPEQIDEMVSQAMSEWEKNKKALGFYLDVDRAIDAEGAAGLAVANLREDHADDPKAMRTIQYLIKSRRDRGGHGGSRSQ